MQTTVAITAKENITGCNSARRTSLGRLILRMGLGGLALLLWQAPPVKAQECCPDQPTQAELASFESSSNKPAKIELTKVQRGGSAASMKMGAGVTTGANAAGNKKSKMDAKAPAVKQTAQGIETAAPTTGKMEAPGDENVPKKADGRGGKNTGRDRS
jgi:hypothetical protein